MDSAGFKTFLELYPQVREAVYDFYHSRYASCIEQLDKLKPDLLLDVHLHDHVKQLCARTPMRRGRRRRRGGGLLPPPLMRRR